MNRFTSGLHLAKVGEASSAPTRQRARNRDTSRSLGSNAPGPGNAAESRGCAAKSWPRADGPAGSGDLAQAVDDLVPVLPDHLAIAEVHLAKVHRAQLVSPLVGFGRDLISDGLTHFVSVVAVLGSAVNRRRTDLSLRFTSAPFVISVGHRTGLFEAMRHLPPATSQEIAGAAELNERYVREWLGAMTAARRLRR
jgi:hypothetical protein